VSSDSPKRATPPAIVLSPPGERRMEVLRLGREKHPVLVVDDMLANPDELREYALGLQFRCPPMTEPAYESTCPLRGVAGLCDWVAHTMTVRGFERDPDDHARGAEGDASFRVFAPDAAHKYRTIHAGLHGWIEVVLGLTPDEDRANGTGFWRHGPSGLESAWAGDGGLDRLLRIDASFGTSLYESSKTAHALAPQSTYQQWVHQLLPTTSSKPPFPAASHGDWELLHAVPARYNRLIAFPTWLFQSVVMTQHARTTLDTARLTMSAFIRHPVLDATQRLPAAPLPSFEQ
jgi:hypothetical protein